MRFTYVILAGLGLVMSGCGSDGAPATTNSSTTTASSGAAAPSANAKVEKAAAIAKAIEANPDGSSEVLRQHGMTVQQFEDLMYEIAADPKMSAAYNARVGG